MLELDLPTEAPGQETDRHGVELQVYGTHSSRTYHGVESEFGPPFPLKDANVEAVVFLQDEQRLLGCVAYTSTDDKAKIRGRVLIVSRGSCTFYQKAVRAQEAGARAIVFVNNEPGSKAFRTLKGPTDSDIPKDVVVRVPSMMVSLEDGIDLTSFIEAAQDDREEEQEEKGAVLTFVVPRKMTTHTAAVRKPLRLKLNGLPLHNLMVLRG